jgi:Domain of unknown function (DUF5666)
MTAPHELHRPFLRRRGVLGLGLALGGKTLLLSACGGAVGEDGTGAYEPAISVGSVNGLSEAALSVNGVNFSIDAATTLLDGLGKPLAADALRLGQWVEISGLVNEMAGLGKADRIQVRSSARGTVSAVDGSGATLTVLQTAARYGDKITVVDGVDNAAALRVGDVVEVHGPLGAAAGTVQATRLELLAAAPSIELRGRVSGVDIVRRRAVIGRQPVDFSQATQTLRQTIANGQVLRVAANTAPSAGADWLVERIASDAPLPANLGFAYAEGVTSGWRTGPYFDLDGLAVDGSTANNRNVITADEQRVAVIGSIKNGVLVAKSLALVRPGQAVTFNLSGAITTFVSAADFRVRNVLIDASTATYTGGAAPDLVDGKKVRVTGSLAGQRLVAAKVEFLPA